MHAPLRTMLARVSPDDIIIYANAALATYLGVSKRSLIGSPLDAVAHQCRGEISTCFERPEGGRTSNRLVTDADDRVFEAKIFSEGAVLDIVLDEVTTADSIDRELRESSGTSVDALNEEELRTARHPERRYLSVSFTRLWGLSKSVERLPPMEARLMVNSFVEEASDAVFETGCTVGETSGDSILGIYGAPRYFADHPLRAIRAACDQQQKSNHLHAGFSREGKELPPCSSGLWTGEVLVGTLGNSAWQRYTAIGSPVDLAEKLSTLARPGEILLPEHTLTHLLRTLPEGWQHIRAEGQEEPDLSDFNWSGDDIAPVPEHLRKIVYLVGPSVQEDTDRIEFYFDYLWALNVPGHATPVPILRVVRPTQVGDSFSLNDDNVVTTQTAQILGKYRLIDVLGTGGMGKVWRGVDRFGNFVAIKVLHASETASEAQLKRFRREAEVMAKLPHRNICRVYEMNEFEGIQYIAMEFVDGLPLSDLLYDMLPETPSHKTDPKLDLPSLIKSIRMDKVSREQQAATEGAETAEAPPRAMVTRVLPIEQTLNLILKVCDAVQFAHEHGVLHRDIKPGNILLREDGEPMVADFGLAKMNTESATHSLSVTGHVVGTMENMAPEQAESSKTVDERADVYSIGTILYQMLTGRRHFEATGNIVADAQVLKTHEPPRPRTLNPQIEPDLEIITLKALRTLPVERYRNVAALRADIEHYRKGEVISAKPVSALDLIKKLIHRNRAISAVVAASFLIIITTNVFFLWQLSHRLSEQKLMAAYAEKQREQSDFYAEEARAKQLEAVRNAEAAKAALDEKTRAEAATMEAQQYTQTLRDQSLTKDEQLAKIQSEAAQKEKELKLLEEQVASLKQFPQPVETQASPGEEKEATGQPSQEQREQVMSSMDQAMRLLNFELSPAALQHMERSPEQALKALNLAMDNVSFALLVSPDFAAGWMLKGRLHLAAMEYDRALKSFQRAEEAASRRPGALEDDDPTAMVELVSELTRLPGEKSVKGVELLRASDTKQNYQTWNLLKFLADKPVLRRNTPLNPLGRLPAPNETALSLMDGNKGASVSVQKTSANRLEVSISGVPEPDLSVLREMDVAALHIQGAERIDWPTILGLSLDALDLSDSTVQAIPLTTRSFVRLRSLALANTAITSLDFVRMMPALENLNVAGTSPMDLTPLMACRSLRQLDISGRVPLNMRALSNLPLETLVITPEMLTDKLALPYLRGLRQLKVLRVPGDSEEQPVSEFWRKFDSGAYPRPVIDGN